MLLRLTLNTWAFVRAAVPQTLSDGEGGTSPKHPPRGFTIPRAKAKSSIGTPGAEDTPGPADYKSSPQLAMGTQQVASTHRHNPRTVFHRPPKRRGHKPGSMRAIFDGADEVVRKADMADASARESTGAVQQAIAEESSVEEPPGPGPTDHCVDTGIGKKQVRVATPYRFAVE